MAKRTGGFIGQDGINAPDPATGVTGTAGNEQVTVSWTAPSNVGGAAITGYNVQGSDGADLGLPSFNRLSYDSVSFNTASQDTSPQDLFFKADGTKMYVLGSTGDAVYEYNLSSAWDVSTASYSQNFSVATQEATPRGVFFKTDGTKMYVTGSSSDSVHEYNVSTAWNISTASFTSTFGVSGQDTSPQGVSFKDDGTKMYMIGSTNEAVYEYTLSTAWDISSASYSQSFSVATETSATTGLFFKPDGTEMFVADNANDAVLQYDLSTAWDVSSASYSQSADISSQVATILGLFFKDDDLKMYVADGSTDSIYQYSLDQYPTASPVTITGLTNDTSYTFNVWAINPFGWSSPSDASGSVTPVQPQIGLFAYGFPNTISEITITTTGNASDFGDLSVNRTPDANASSSTRSVFAGGASGNVMDYVTFTSAGNATDFGDLSTTTVGSSGTSNGTRGVIGGGNVSGTISNVMLYLTIATTGNTSDYGDLSVSRSNLAANVNSPTRGVYAGGQGQDGDPTYNNMDYITIATTGNASDFGDLLAVTRNLGGLSSSTRGLFFGGNTTDASTLFNTIQYITIASTGNATDFGDLAQNTQGIAGIAGLTRGVMGGGNDGLGSNLNTIQYVTTATTGNTSDFGDLLDAQNFPQNAGSSAHGGLS
jgi:hypothetical protein